MGFRSWVSGLVRGKPKQLVGRHQIDAALPELIETYNAKWRDSLITALESGSDEGLCNQIGRMCTYAFNIGAARVTRGGKESIYDVPLGDPFAEPHSTVQVQLPLERRTEEGRRIVRREFERRQGVPLDEEAVKKRVREMVTHINRLRSAETPHEEIADRHVPPMLENVFKEGTRFRARRTF